MLLSHLKRFRKDLRKKIHEVAFNFIKTIKKGIGETVGMVGIVNSEKGLVPTETIPVFN